MLTVFPLSAAQKWDPLVRSFAAHDVYWLSGYARGFQLHGDGEPLLFSYSDGRLRAINVVMRRDIGKDPRFAPHIPCGRYFDLSTPYGYGGWLAEGEGLERAFAAYARWCRQNGVVAEFVRFHPLCQNHVLCAPFYQVEQRGRVVHMDLHSSELIWRNLSCKNRNALRKAIKNGVEVYCARTPEIYQRFRVLYDKTMDKVGAKAYYYFDAPFYRSMAEDLPDNALVFYAALPNGMMIAAAIMLLANRCMSYHLAGSLPEYRGLAASGLILYKAALWGCEHGYQTLFLGGGVGSEEDKLFHFKRAFYRGDLHHFYIGKKIFDQARYDELVRLRGEMEESDYFPLYRMEKNT